MKQCKRCNETKPLEEFHKSANSPLGRHTYCKACRSIMRSIYRKKNKEDEINKEKLRYINSDKFYEENKDTLYVTCSCCKESKLMNFFNRKANSPKGIDCYCKECNRNKNRKYRQENKEYLSNYVKQYRENNPEKYKAHYTLQNAVREGHIEKQPCNVCGSINVEAHHEDYSKPLDIIWLCRRCHIAVHKNQTTN